MTLAAVVETAGAPFTVREVDLEPIQDTEMQVRLVATGVCHTDISAASGSTPFPLPGVLGHEGAGVVTEVGARVTRAAVGDRVLLTFTSCGRCTSCRTGHPAYCDHHLRLNLLGGRRDDGSATMSADGVALNAHFFGQSSFAELAVVDERSVVVLPPDVTDDELAVLAPLGCGFQTGAGAVINVLRPGAGQSLVVLGAGAVGLAAVMAATMTPAARIVVVDRVADRLTLALELGATHVIDTTTEDLVESVLALTGGRGADHAVETTGSTAVLEAAIESLAIGGTCAVIGAPRAGSRAAFDVNRLIPGRVVRGITLGDSEPETFLPALVAAVRSGAFPIDRLERRYGFRDIATAVADATSGATIKPVLIHSSFEGARA